MKKRLICLVLCLAMILLPALVACSGDKTDEEITENISEKASVTAKTLSMWVVSEKKLSDETINTVSEALNSITKSKFKTQLVLTFLTKDVYEAELTEQLTDWEKYRSDTGLDVTEAATTAGADAPEATDATMTLANGMTVIKYPELAPYQTDIIYIAGEEMFNDYVGRGWLTPLDEYLDGSAKKVREYISSTLLSATELNGVTYAIPNNNVIGEYKYMLLDKELMKKYSQDGYITKNMIDGFFNQYLQNFLLQVKEFEPDYAPVDASYEDCLGLLAHYWNVDPASYKLLDDFSVFGYHYTDIEDLSRGSVILGYDSLFENDDFTKDFLKLNELKYNGYFNGDLEESQKKSKAAVKFVDGDSTVLDTYKDDYYAVVVQYPTATTDDIYSNMFGVCAFSPKKAAAVEVIAYLNTNPDFRNILQYGVENVHYTLKANEEGTKTELVRLNNDYMMDIYATGNAFLAYPEPDMSADIWEQGKVQNRASLVSPLLGFNIRDFAIEAGTKSESIKLPDEKYIATYSTGYSKDILSQNDTIKAWLAAADASENKGVFVLKSQQLSGQNLTLNYYIYNNRDSGKVFTMNGTSRTEPSTDKYGNEVKDDKGNVVMKVTGFDIEFSYVDGDPVEKGYELTCLTIHTTKSIDFEVKLKDGTYVPNETKKLVTFDFMNTKTYSVDVYENLSKAAVAKNEVLLNWLIECDKASTSKINPKTFVKQFVNQATGEVTYVVYRVPVQYETDIAVQITGDSKNVTVNLDFRYDEENGEKAEANYLLYYIRINPVGGAKIGTDFSIKDNGEHAFGVVEQTWDADPDFLMLGNLDTELVKYIYALNNDVVAVLNNVSGDTPEQKLANLEAIIAELKILLSADEDVTNRASLGDFVILKDLAEKYAVDGHLNDMFYYVRCATSSSKVERNPDIYGDKWSDPNPDSTWKEDYVYFDSLYGLYEQWMSKYGYKPAEK